MITVKKLQIIVGLKALALIVIIGSFFYSNAYFSKIKSKLSRQERSFKSEVMDYQGKIDSFNAKTQDIADALTTWEYLTSDETTFAGLKIGVARNIIDKLRTKYNFKDLDIQMSKPELMDGEYRGEVVGTEFSKIKMSIQGLTDVQIFHFIYDLSTSFPGYLSFSSYNIKQDREINQTFLSQLGDDTNISAVSAEIECTWSELKELE